ncbi:MAG TPA: Ig-like domain-containing protein [Spirochaetota bacterium]|nr:Ig-like domain-containing protein [Spirochaetota bacterium]
MKYTLTAILLLATAVLGAQTALTIEEQTYINSDGSWAGVNIPRSVPTKLTFRNNSITSINTSGYMLQAGDEEPAATNNNLEGAIITGNKFVWTGTDMKSITHGLFTGHNLNAVVKYNYLDHVPMGIIRKSGNNMSNTGGGVAYNIVKSGAVGINIKGMSNVNVYNNTLYTDRTTSETWRGLIYIYTHTDITPNSVSHGTKIFNNIFYTKHQTYCIQIDDVESTIGLESDYNIFYCESGIPLFFYCGEVKTFAQWQALGYDTHSRVINPNFKDFVNFVPAARLDYGKNLGTEWAEGLSINARWGTTDPEKVTQNGIWQVGAVIHKATATSPANQPPNVTISSPTKSTAFIAPAMVTIDAIATDPDGAVAKVEFYNGTIKLGEKTSAPWSFSWKEVPAGTYSVTAAATDNLNSRTISDPVTVVVEKAAAITNQLPTVTISLAGNQEIFEAPAKISFMANASDSDGSIVKVEFYVGQKKSGETLHPPYNYIFECDSAGTYEVTAKAYDNMNATVISESLRFTVNPAKPNNNFITLYPNPNHGTFNYELNSLGEEEDLYTVSIISLTGITVYSRLSSSPDTNKTIDISDSPGGNYILTVSSGGKVISSKQFIKL